METASVSSGNPFDDEMVLIADQTASPRRVQIMLADLDDTRSTSSGGSHASSTSTEGANVFGTDNAALAAATGARAGSTAEFDPYDPFAPNTFVSPVLVPTYHDFLDEGWTRTEVHSPAPAPAAPVKTGQRTAGVTRSTVRQPGRPPSARLLQAGRGRALVAVAKKATKEVGKVNLKEVEHLALKYNEQKDALSRFFVISGLTAMYKGGEYLSRAEIESIALDEMYTAIGGAYKAVEELGYMTKEDIDALGGEYDAQQIIDLSNEVEQLQLERARLIDVPRDIVMTPVVVESVARSKALAAHGRLIAERVQGGSVEQMRAVGVHVAAPLVVGATLDEDELLRPYPEGLEVIQGHATAVVKVAGEMGVRHIIDNINIGGFADVWVGLKGSLGQGIQAIELVVARLSMIVDSCSGVNNNIRMFDAALRSLQKAINAEGKQRGKTWGKVYSIVATELIQVTRDVHGMDDGASYMVLREALEGVDTALFVSDDPTDSYSVNMGTQWLTQALEANSEGGKFGGGGGGSGGAELKAMRAKVEKLEGQNAVLAKKSSNQRAELASRAGGGPNRNRSKGGRPNSRGSKKRCSVCDEEGCWSDRCQYTVGWVLGRNKKWFMGTKDRPLTCHSCGKNGHHADDCPNPRANSSRAAVLEEEPEEPEDFQDGGDDQEEE